jgi:hypothetical protein
MTRGPGPAIGIDGGRIGRAPTTQTLTDPTDAAIARSYPGQARKQQPCDP